MSLFRPGRINELRGWDEKNQPEFQVSGSAIGAALALVAVLALLFA